MSQANRRRAGFSLIELIVAMTILSVGLLALAGTALTVTRQMRTSTLRTEAANIAGQRFEELRSMRKRNCSAFKDSSASWPRGIQEGWRYAPVPREANANKTLAGDSAVMITDSVTFTVRRGSPVKIVFQSVLTCTPG